MKRLLWLLLIVPWVGLGATGDILSVATYDGWSVSNLVSGLSTGGVYSNGLGSDSLTLITNMVKGNETYVLTVTSSGYDNTGTATTWPRKVYGTKITRIAGTVSPNETTGAGGNLTNNFALSDYIYSGDTVTAQINPGWVVQGGHTNTAFSGAVANNCTQVVPLVVGNWSRPNFKKISASTMRLGFVAFHGYPRNGNPVACVKFIVKDQHSHSVTNTETAMRIDYSLGETIPTPEYYTDINISGMTQGDQLVCDVQAFPWIGTSVSILDTAVVRGWEGARWTWHPVTQTNICDTANTYCPFIAVVDAVNGNDANGRATNTTPANVNSAHYFLTMGQAVLFLQNSNNAFSTPTHNDPGGGIVYCKANVTNFPGSNPTINRSACDVTIAPYPGASVSINTVSTTIVPWGHHIYWTNINAISTVNYLLGANVEHVVWDNCLISNTAAISFSGLTNLWLLNCNIVTNNPGFQVWANATPSGILFRNCWFNRYGGGSDIIYNVFMMGCHRDNTNYYAFNVSVDQGSFVETRPDFVIWYNNLFRGLCNVSGGQLLNIGINYGTSNGIAIVQNVFESCTNVVSPEALILFSADTLNTTNWLIFNNVILTKLNAFYNETGSSAVYSWFIFMKNNVFGDYNIKGDVFGTANAARIGNWPALWGVGFTGNCFPETTNIIPTSSGQFESEFSGLNAIGENMAPNSTGTQRPASFMSWVNPQYWDGSAQNSWPGGGIYKVNNNSFAENMQLLDRIIPFDLEGNARGASDPPGPYCSGSPRKGGGFFGQ